MMKTCRKGVLSNAEFHFSVFLASVTLGQLIPLGFIFLLGLCFLFWFFN
jgi:hypothetical protein